MLTGWRTYLISALSAAFGVLAVVDWNTFLQDPKAGWSIIAMSVMMAVMRSITTTPPGKEE